MNLRAWISYVVAASLLAGCSSDSDPNGSSPATTTHSVVALTATLTQSRVNEGTRIINAELTNPSDAPVTVDTITLDSSQFEARPPEEKGSVFAPGQTIDLAIEYGEPTCDGDLAQSSFTAVIDDVTAELSIDAAGMDWLNRLYNKECALKSIAEIADISYGPTFTRATVDGELVLTGELVLRRPAGSDTSPALTVRGLAGSVLVRFEPNPRSALPAELTSGLEELRVPIEFGAFRCDQHARGQSSQTFLLSVFVKPPDLPQQRVILVPDKHVQAQILTLIDDVCGNSIF